LYQPVVLLAAPAEQNIGKCNVMHA